MHPIVKVVLLISLLLLINMLNVNWVLIISVTVCGFAVCSKGNRFLKVLKRMRWLWLSLLLVYSFSTPGEYVIYIPNAIAPTLEGIEAGLSQIARLCTVLACLHLLFSNSSKEELLAALYYLLIPFKWIGLDVASFAVRLYLTLDYVENITTQTKVGMQFLQALHQPTISQNETPIEIPKLSLVQRDKLIILVAMTSVISVLISKLI